MIGAFLAERRNAVVAGIRRDGRPHLSPNWFCCDGQRFYVSTTRSRVRYTIFRRDPRVQLLIDDPTGFRAVLIPATVEIREDIAATGRYACRRGLAAHCAASHSRAGMGVSREPLQDNLVGLTDRGSPQARERPCATPPPLYLGNRGEPTTKSRPGWPCTGSAAGDRDQCPLPCRRQDPGLKNTSGAPAKMLLHLCPGAARGVRQPEHPFKASRSLCHGPGLASGVIVSTLCGYHLSLRDDQIDASAVLLSASESEKPVPGRQLGSQAGTA